MDNSSRVDHAFDSGKSGIIPESGPYLNPSPSWSPKCWQPNSAIAQPVSIVGEATTGSPIKCHVHGLSPVSVLTFEEISASHNQPHGSNDTDVGIEISPPTDEDIELRSFHHLRDIDILFESAGATTITVTAEVDGVSPFNTDTTLPITVSGSGLGFGR